MVILAAGASTRMGRAKQLLPWKNSNLINHVINEGLKANVHSIYVVLGSNSKEISESILSDGINTINNPLWKEGMGTSIAVALRFLIDNSENYDAILFALVDQPLLEKAHYSNLIDSYISANRNIVATQLKSKVGVPAIIGSKYFDRLKMLDGNIGAKELIGLNKKDVLAVEPIGQCIDIDNYETYKTLYNKFSK